MKATVAGFPFLAAFVLAAPAVAQQTATAPQTSAAVERGEYLVKGFGCGDCHTPWKMGPSGPEPDNTLFLSGHPEKLTMPAVPALPEGPWLGVYSGTMTAWAGPWGVSFSANLTPDKETGLGSWTEQMFVDAMRSGRHMGKGRPILPPMPYPAYRNLTDDDLKAIFGYLQSITALRNQVPDPIPPGDAVAQ
jgi:hypothetical protein